MVDIIKGLKSICTILAFCPLPNALCSVCDTHKGASQVPRLFQFANSVVGSTPLRFINRPRRTDTLPWVQPGQCHHIPKGPPSSSVANYRPISITNLTSVWSKVLELFLKVQIILPSGRSASCQYAVVHYLKLLKESSVLPCPTETQPWPLYYFIFKKCTPLMHSFLDAGPDPDSVFIFYKSFFTLFLTNYSIYIF